MRTNPKFGSDEFEVFDDADFVSGEDEFAEPGLDESLDTKERHLTAWQRIDRHYGDRELRNLLDDWESWDESPATH